MMSKVGISIPIRVVPREFNAFVSNICVSGEGFFDF